MDDRLSKAEIRKDTVQEIVGAGASTVGEVTSIITTAVKDVANAIGGLATDMFEIRDGARRASKRLDDDPDEQ
ncbi:hypothetical protein [Mycolicibacterium sp. CR10]|jgi:hypothetical protein|uniref:hypothetical protein n=1 Tax=Mycolicibacterium sp. CR10 TaxID=2562314 RepID=UPI0010C02990|nr:hypothetical protein [Mycolicibacterium sp. CR10]